MERAQRRNAGQGDGRFVDPIDIKMQLDRRELSKPAITGYSAEAIALELARSGLPVFPCLAESKRPACRWNKDATTDASTIRRWWRRNPEYLIGVPTGPASGISVLDVDPDGCAWLEEHRNRLPMTRMHKTRRGSHLLFEHQPGLHNSAGKVAPGIDVRGDGGYFIWWPQTGLPVLCDAPPAPWPDWLLPPAPLRRAISAAKAAGSHGVTDLHRQRSGGA